MTIDKISPGTPDARGTGRSIQQFRLRLVAALAVGLTALAIFNAATFMLLQRQIDIHEADAALLNRLGMERSLSQRVLVLAELMVSSTDPDRRTEYRTRLRETADEMEQNHNGLIHADPKDKGPGVLSPAVRGVYFAEPDRLDERVHRYLAAARELAWFPNAQLRSDSPLLAALREVGLDQIFPLADRVVSLHQMEDEELAAQTGRLSIALLAFSLAGIGLVALLIFRPMVQRIAAQTNSLILEIGGRERVEQDLRATEEALRRSNSQLAAARDASQRLLYQLPIGIQVFDSTGLCTDVNQAHLDLFGVQSRDSLVGRQNILNDPLAERAGTVAGFQKALAGEIARMGDIDFNLEQADPRFAGTVRRRIANVTLVPIFDENARVANVVGVNQDITERKRAEEALRRSETYFRAAAEGSPDAFFIFQCLHDETGQVVDFTFVDVNTRGTEFAQLPREKLLGQRMCELFPIARTIGVFEKYVRAFETGQGLEEEFLLSGTSLGDAWLRHQVVPLPDGIAISTRDVTERQRADEQLRYQAHLLQNVSDAIISVDLEVRIQSWNRAAEELFGWRAEEVIGKTLPEVLQPEYFEGWTSPMVRQALLEKGQWSGERLARHQNGSVVHTWVSISLMHDSKGEPVGSVGVMHDITERKRVERAEADQRRLAEALRDTAATLTSTLDLDTVMRRILDNVERVIAIDTVNIMLIKEGTAQITFWRGYPAESDDPIKADQYDLDMPTLAHMLATGNPLVISDVGADPRWKATGGLRLTQSYMGAPIRAHGRIIGFLNLNSATPGFFTADQAGRLQAFADQVSIAIENAQLYAEINRYAANLEQRVLERTAALQTANERLQELDRLKSKFIADVSHELRTPVANLSMRLYLLEHDSPEKFPKHLDILKKNVGQLMTLLDNVLDFSRLENAERNFAQVSINEVIESVLLAHSARAEAASLDLSYEPGANLPPVWGDANQLAQVATNLLTNAINYTATGQIRVVTLMDSERHQVCLLVQDSGSGIHAEDLEHLFERFYRGKQASQSTIRGTGLGLSIVKEIVDVHGGSVEVETALGQGSTFRVWLPLAEMDSSRVEH